VFKVAVDPENGQRLFAATGRGLHRSDDGASTWYQPEQCAMWVFSLAVNPSRRTTLLVGSAAGEMCRSNDAGYTWETVGAGLPWVNVLALVWLPGATRWLLRRIGRGSTVAPTQARHGAGPPTHPFAASR
jgi:ligand-binding sensor domain-containing protein